MTSPIINAKRACERRLTQLSTPLPTAYEGVSFVAPAGLYLRTQFVLLPPDDPVIGAGFYRERMVFQVFVCDLLNIGTTNALTKAELIRSLFSKGTAMQESGNNIFVYETPQISGSAITNSRLVVPVLINLAVEVFS